MWSDQTKKNPFDPTEILNPQEAKYQIINVILEAAHRDQDIKSAVEADGISFDEDLLHDLIPGKTAGLLPDYKDEETKLREEYRIEKRKARSASGLYLLVGEGIHKSIGDPIPHITCRIFSQANSPAPNWEDPAAAWRSYHLQVRFDNGEWKLVGIKREK